MMEQEHRQFAARFADVIVAGDFDSAHGLLAPWLQRAMSPADVQATVEARLREMMEYAGTDELTYPVGYDLDYNSSTLESLREPRSWAPRREIPPEVTPENFRQWACLQFLADENLEIDAWFDLWMIVVETDAGYGVGYFELEDPD